MISLGTALLSFGIGMFIGSLMRRDDEASANRSEQRTIKRYKAECAKSQADIDDWFERNKPKESEEVEPVEAKPVKKLKNAHCKDPKYQSQWQ